MRFTLVVPGLLDWPAPALARIEKHAPALSRLVVSGGSPAIEPDGLVATACRVCGIAKQQDWPVGPWLARAAGIDVGRAYWLCAEPARFIVAANDIRLAGLLSDLEAADAQLLVAMLNAHFAADRVCFVAPTPAHWFARTEEPAQIVTRPPEAALGAPLLAYLATGRDGARWRGWQNELQMLLFEHPVNRRREASGLSSVDSVWLWGGGTLAERDPPAARIFANDGVVGALARGAGLAPEPLLATFAALPRAAALVAWLDAIGDDGGDAQLSAIETAWFAPVERALRGGAIAEVELVIAGRALALGFRLARPSLAQRWRWRFAPPEASARLARWVAGASGN